MLRYWDDLFSLRMRGDFTRFLPSKIARAIKRGRNSEGMYNIAQYATKEELSRIRTSVANVGNMHR